MKYINLFDNLNESINGATPINELIETLSQYKELLEIGMLTKENYAETVREIIVSELIAGLDVEHIMNLEKLGLAVLDFDLYHDLANSILAKQSTLTNLFDVSVKVWSFPWSNEWDDEDAEDAEDIAQQWTDDCISAIEQAAEEINDWVSPDGIRVVIGSFYQTGEDKEEYDDDWEIIATMVFSNGAILKYTYIYFRETVMNNGSILKIGDESIDVDTPWVPHGVDRSEYWTSPFYEAVKHLTPNKLIK